MDYSFKKGTIKSIFKKMEAFIVPSENNNFKSKFIQSDILLFCVVLLFVLKIATILVFVNFPNNIFFADITKITLENFANQARQSIGLEPLVVNEKLDQAAKLKAENMVENQYFNHTSPTGISPWHWFLKAGYSYKYAGENLAIGFFDSKEVFEAWLNSPSHRENILNSNYKEIGTAVVQGYGGNNTIVVVQEFASPLSAVITPVETKKKIVENAETQEDISKIQESEQKQPDKEPEKVLSQVSESDIVIESSKDNTINNIIPKITNSVFYNYEEILQKIIYGFGFVIMGVLMVIMFLNSNTEFKRDFVFRSILLVSLLALTMMVNKDIVTSFMPHHVII